MEKLTDEFRLKFNKLHKIGDKLLKDKEDKLQFALCQAEFERWSCKINDLIDKVAETDYDNTEEYLDKLLDDLVLIKMSLYDELEAWIKPLRTPLQKAIDEVESQLNTIDDGEE